MSTVESELEHATDSAVASLTRRAPRISQAEVFQAADALLVEGHRPTIDRVRMRLGRGSPNTINDHLDAWWNKLGARLRDLPGREFPQLPERVAQTLQRLWNEALEGAHEVLQGTLTERKRTIDAREQALEIRARQVDEREQVSSQRTATLEEGLTLAREQLAAANLRAERLETTLQERASECTRLSERMETLEVTAAELRAKLEATAATHKTERTRLEEWHAVTEARWLTEVDRVRQLAKETTKEHDRQAKDWRAQLARLQAERDQFRQDLFESRSEVKTAAAVREQLEERLLAAAPSTRTRRLARPTRAPKKRLRPHRP